MIRNELSSKKPTTILEKIEESLERLNDKMEVMIEIQRNNGSDGSPKTVPFLPDASLDVMTLLSMPDHLRKTAMTICRCGRATAEEISAYCKGKIASFKIPKNVFFIKDEEMPRTGNGKILHRVLREKYGMWKDHQ